MVEIDRKRIRIDLIDPFFCSILRQLDEILYTLLLFTKREDLDLNTKEIKDDILNQTIGFFFADYVNSE